MASILVIGPHPDDQELGMGGTIALLASQGHRVTLLDMTDGEPTPRGDPATRAAEAAAAVAKLSPPSGHAVQRVMLGRESGLINRVVEPTIQGRHAIAGVIRRVQAQILFVPLGEDAHPDHVAVTRMAEDARFDAKLTGLPMPGDGGMPPIHPRWLFHYHATHLRTIPQASFLVDISATVERKFEAIACYRSQFELHEPNRHVPQWVRAWNRFLGSRIGVEHAEAFVAREPIGLSGLQGLVMPG